MSGSVQELMQQARELLSSRSAPITPDNLNRAMIMLTGSGDARTEQTAEGLDMNAQVDRVMQRSTPRRANVPRNTQPNAVVGASGTAPDEGAVPDMTLPMPVPDVRQAARETAQPITFIPGEGEMYPPLNANPTSALDGNGMQNRLLRDLVMGAESAGAVSGAMPQVGAGYFGRIGLPNIRLGLNRPQIAGPSGGAAQLGDDVAGAAVANTPRPALPGGGGAQAALPAPQAALPAPTPPTLGPMQRQALRGPELGPAQQQARRGPELGPMQQQTLRGPNVKPRNMSAAQRQRRQNIAESP